MTEDLITWLRSVLDEEERRAKRIRPVSDLRWEYVRDDDGPLVKTASGAWALEDVNVQVWQCEDEMDGCPDAAREWAAEARWIAAHDHESVLRDIKAKRQLLDWLDRLERVADSDDLSWWRLAGHFDVDAARLHLASAYSDRPGYRQEWRV